MKKHILFSALLTLTTSLAFADEDEIETLYSKAILSEISKVGLVGGSSKQVCTQSLDNLPQVSIGLGSSGNPLGENDEKVRTLTKILSDTELAETPFEIRGYADGKKSIA